MSAIGPQELRALIAAMAAGVNAERETLNRLDAAIGDGDHGAAICTAFTVAADETAALNDPRLSDIWLTTAKALMNRMGGASGAIFGTFFLKGVAPMRDVERIGKDDLAWVLAAGLAGVKARGKATVGDKTMVDALEPAVLAFSVAADYDAAFSAAAAAARAGADSTKALVARQGRAKFLGERSIGHIDPGAWTIATMFAAIDNWWKTQR